MSKLIRWLLIIVTEQDLITKYFNPIVTVMTFVDLRKEELD